LLINIVIVEKHFGI